MCFPVPRAAHVLLQLRGVGVAVCRFRVLAPRAVSGYAFAIARLPLLVLRQRRVGMLVPAAVLVVAAHVNWESLLTTNDGDYLSLTNCVTMCAIVSLRGIR